MNWAFVCCCGIALLLLYSGAFVLRVWWETSPARYGAFAALNNLIITLCHRLVGSVSRFKSE